MYHHTCHSNLFGFVDLERRVRNFILDKAVGLLQSLQSKTPPKTFGDIESGLWNAAHTQPTNDRSQHCPGYERSRSIVVLPGGDDTHSTNSPSDRSIERRANQQPQFTEGPARFVTATDGSKDCIALLVTDALIAKLRDLHEDSYHLLGKEGPRDVARRDARELEISLSQIMESIEVDENQERIAELKKLVQQHEYRLFKVQQLRDELDNGAKQLEARVTSTKSQIQWVLHNAMKEADLLEPHRPLTPVTMTIVETGSETSEDCHHTKNREHNAADNATAGVDYAMQHSASLEGTDDIPEDLRLIRQEAWQSYNEALVTMHKVQEVFDDRQESYETDLAEYRRGVANGTYKISRSEFDRSKIRYGQKVTQALIKAEEAFEAAKERAQAVGALGHDYDDATTCYGCSEESRSESQLGSDLTTKEWSHVHEWLANVSNQKEHGETRETQPSFGSWKPDLVDLYADELDPADSISQVDFDEYRKSIDRWENIRFHQWEDMRTRVGGPEICIGFLVRSIEPLKRRHSASLCHSEAVEWERNT